MARSERTALAGKRRLPRDLNSPWAANQAGEKDERKLLHGSRAALDAAVLKDFAMISRFGQEQQFQAIQDLQHSHGNAVVARAIAGTREGTVARSPWSELKQQFEAKQDSPEKPKETFVPELHVSTDEPQLNVGEERNVNLDVTNADAAPPGSYFRWLAEIKQSAPSGVVSLGDTVPHVSPHAVLPIKGRVPGQALIITQVNETRPPNGLVAAPSGPTLMPLVRRPGVENKRVIIKGQDGKERLATGVVNLQVGDSLEVTCEFRNVEPGIKPSTDLEGAGLFDVLEPQPTQWVGPTMYMKKFKTLRAGNADVRFLFWFGDMTRDQAIKTSVQAQVTEGADSE